MVPAAEQTRGYGGCERILLVDDEPLVLKINMRELLRLGYQVVGMPSGEAALEYLRHHEADLVVLDLVMPGIDGMETLRRMRELRPGLKTMAYTGHADPTHLEHARNLGLNRHLLKPASLADFARTVRDTLDHPQRTSIPN